MEYIRGMFGRLARFVCNLSMAALLLVFVIFYVLYYLIRRLVCRIGGK